MKMLMLIFNVVLEKKVMSFLEKLDIECYTKFQDVLGAGEKSKPHLDTHIWPGKNTVLQIATDEISANKIIDEINILREQYPHEGVKIFSWTLEEIEEYK